MLRYLSRKLLSKSSICSRAFEVLQTTGSPTSSLARILHQNNSTLCKYPSLANQRNKLENVRNTVYYTTHKKVVDDIGLQFAPGSVQKVIGLYLLTKQGQQSASPLETLDCIVKCARKSAKEACILLQDLDTLNKFECVLKDVEVVLDRAPQMQSIVSIFSSLAEIVVRQKTFLNQTDIDVYASHITEASPEAKAQEPHNTNIGKKLFLKYESLILSRIDDFSSKELVNILWCYAETGYGNKQFYEELKNRILKLQIADLTNEDIAKIVCSFAKLKTVVDLSDITSKVENEISLRGIISFGNEEIINVLFAFASLQHNNKKFYHEIVTEFLNRDARSFTPVQICKVLWSSAKISSKHHLNLSNLFNRFADEIMRRGVKRFDIRGLTVITWSFVEGQYFSKHLFASIRNEITRRNIKTFDAVDLSILLRSFAKVKNRIHANKFFSKVDKELVGRRLGLFTNRHLATTLWSFAATGNGSHAFYDMTKREVTQRRPKEFTAVEFSQLIWSFAKAKDKANVRDLLLQIDYNVSKLSFRQLALVLWSYSVADVDHIQLITDLNKEISNHDLSKANHPMICQIMFGLATFKQVAPSEKVIKFLEKSIVESGIKLFEHRQLAVLVWTFCELNQFCKSTKIYKVLSKGVCSRSTREFMPSDICRLLCGFAQVTHLIDTTATFHTLTKELLRRGLGEFSTTQVTMATVALSTANQWDGELVHLFEEETVSYRNARSFDGIHLCSLAKSFLKMSHLDAVKLFCWLEGEVIGRDVYNFCPKDLLEILEVLLDRKATKVDFFETVKNQLLTSNFKNYSKDDTRKICELLVKAGIDVETLLLIA